MTKTCETCRWWSDHGDTEGPDRLGGCVLRLNDPDERNGFTLPSYLCADWRPTHQPKKVTP